MRSALMSAIGLVFAFSQPASAQSEQDLLDRIAVDPADGTARLTLAELDFAANRDQSAEFNARQALAGNVTEEEADRARDILAALQRRRAWIATSDFAFAPETERTVFRDADPTNDQTDDLVETVETSGFGVLGFGSLENRIALSEDLRWSTQAIGRAEVFQDSDFNAFDATLLTGPLFLGAGDDRTGIRALAQARWLGDEQEFTALGGEVFSQRALSDRVRVFSRFTYRDVDYDIGTARDGQTYAIDGAVSRFGLSGRFEQAFALAFRNDANAASQSFWFYRLGAGAYRETGFGLGVFVQPSFFYQDFDGADPSSGLGREDTGGNLLVRTVKRDWRLFGTSPYISVILEKSDSSVNRFDREDVTLQAGFTRTF